MAIQTLTCTETDEVSGAAVTMTAPGVSVAFYPGALLSTTESLAVSAASAAIGLLVTAADMTTGLVSSVIGLVGCPRCASRHPSRRPRRSGPDPRGSGQAVRAGWRGPAGMDDAPGGASSLRQNRPGRASVQARSWSSTKGRMPPDR